MYFVFILYLIIYGDWGLGIGDWGLGIGPNPQSPIPNPQSTLIINKHILDIFDITLFFLFTLLFLRKWVEETALKYLKNQKIIASLSLRLLIKHHFRKMKTLFAFSHALKIKP